MKLPFPKALHWQFALLVLASLACGTSAQAQVVQAVRNPANGHYYALITGYHDWEGAKGHARGYVFNGMQGHLATITSAEENQFIVTTFATVHDSDSQFWIGGYQSRSASGYSEPSGGWQWITGEPWSYTNWAPNEPNNLNTGDPTLTPDEDCLMLIGNPVGSWNDGRLGLGSARGFLVEFEPSAAISSIKIITQSGPLAKLQAGNKLAFAGGIENSNGETGWGNATPDKIQCLVKAVAGRTVKWIVEPYAYSGKPYATGKGDKFEFEVKDLLTWADLFNPRPRLSFVVTVQFFDLTFGDPIYEQMLHEERVKVTQHDLGQLRQEYVDHPVQPPVEVKKVPPVSEFQKRAKGTPWNKGLYDWAIVRQWATDFVAAVKIPVTSVYRHPVKHWITYRDETSCKNAPDPTQCALDTVKTGSQHMFGTAVDLKVVDSDGDGDRDFADYHQVYKAAQTAISDIGKGTVHWEGAKMLVNNIHVHAQEVGTGTPVPPLPTVSISNPTITEGDASTRRATFTITLSQSPYKHPTAANQNLPVTIRWKTAPGTAMAGSDYTIKSGTVTFPAGTTTLTQEIGVPIVGDTATEANETFKVEITARDAAYAGGIRAGTCTITDNDSTTTQ